MPPDRSLPDARLHVVTGKGGTGKTTVAAAMATGFARQGERVLLVEVEERQGIAQVLDVAPLGEEERVVRSDPSGGEVVGLAVDARAALLEYLQRFYRLGPAGSVLQRVGAVDFATTIAPGVRDVLLIGKVYEAVGRRTRGERRSQAGRAGTRRGARGASRPAFDRVVLDAPPTGRIARFLGVNQELSAVARVGPIRAQADSITSMLRSRETLVHVVTVLEEMPVQETRDAVAELRALSLRPGWVLANMVREPLLADSDLPSDPQVAQRTVADGLTAAGVEPTATMVSGLVAQAEDHLARAALQAEQDVALDELDAPLAHLPFLADGVESGELGVLADVLVTEGVIRDGR